MIQSRTKVTCLVGALLLLSVVAASGQVTNFSTDVATSIDNGLTWLDGQGAFNNPSNCGQAAGLCLLALLEKRGSDFGDPPQGYAGASAVDQGRMRLTTAYILGQIPSVGVTYRDGAFMMALSLYLQTGGPDRGDHPDLPGGLPFDLIGGLNHIFDKVHASQNSPHGYWCYEDGFNTACDDSSTTQFVVAGLASLRGVYSDPLYSDPARLAQLDTDAAEARQAYVDNALQGGFGGICSADERGHGYNRGNSPSIQQTGSGLWIQLVGGADLNDASVQAYMRWLYHRYRFTDITSASDGFEFSYWYYLWTTSKAIKFLDASGVSPDPGNLAHTDIGMLPPGDAPVCGGSREVHRDPTADPRVPLFGGEGPGYYSDFPAGNYYDFAHEVLAHQLPGGRYDPNPQGLWDQFSQQSYALLVLERSTGGGCLDSDDDGVCDEDDNCPSVPNPDQTDSNDNGIGDACDESDPPDCFLSGFDPGPPMAIEVTTQDVGTGLDQILVTHIENAAVDIPVFTPGTNDIQLVTAEKIDQSLPASLELTVIDVSGNETVCDPVMVRMRIPKGQRRVTETFHGIPEYESFISLQNSSPGVKRFQAVVNGSGRYALRLQPEQEALIDVSKSMVPGDNTMTLSASGAPGSWLIVLISDGVGEEGARALASRLRGVRAGDGANLNWGSQR